MSAFDGSGALMPFGIVLGGLSLPALAALGGGGMAALVALHLLRRRPARVVVAFASLWLASADRRAERRARRLRRWLSLASKLAIFALLLVAAAQPRRAASGLAGRTLVILIDRSASMQANDDPGSRFARACALARAAIDDMEPGDRALVAGFARDVTALGGLESDKARLRAAVASMRASDEPGDLPRALAIVGALLAGQPHATLLLISDGAMPDAAGDDVARALAGVDVRWAPVGRRGDNVAIVAFSARRAIADPSSAEIALVAQSFRSTPSTVTVAITSGPARVPIATRQIRLAPRARAAVTLFDVAIGDGRLEAVLRDAHRDDLPLDDRAVAVVPDAAPARVMVIGNRNLFLDGALLSLGAAVTVEHVAADAWRDTRSRWETADAVIFDGVTPDPAPTTGRFLYIDPGGRASPWADRGRVVDPIVSDTLRDHPLAKQLGLSDLNIAAARRLALGRDDVAVVSAPGAPLVIARATAQLKLVGLAFDVRRSDFPLRGAFPLFLANALSWLAPRLAADGESFPTGRTVTVRAPGASRTATLVLDRVGIMDVGADSDAHVMRMAANLANPAESDLRPRTDLRIAGRTPPPPDPPRAPHSHHEPWRLALLVALVLLAVDWIALHRRLIV